MIDNYDSFVHNLARYFVLAGWECEVVRNDCITLDDIVELEPEGIVLSPGPCTPSEAGISVEAVKKFGSLIPMLGVCLGHQCIGEAYGAETKRAIKPVHGKCSIIEHNGRGLFKDIPNPLQVGRYHSLIVEPDSITDLEVTARTSDGEIMGFVHKSHPVYGVQFHPESVLTENGQGIVNNFTNIARQWNEEHEGLVCA